MTQDDIFLNPGEAKLLGLRLQKRELEARASAISEQMYELSRGLRTALPLSPPNVEGPLIYLKPLKDGTILFCVEHQDKAKADIYPVGPTELCNAVVALKQRGLIGYDAIF